MRSLKNISKDFNTRQTPFIVRKSQCQLGDKREDVKIRQELMSFSHISLTFPKNYFWYLEEKGKNNT